MNLEASLLSKSAPSRPTHQLDELVNVLFTAYAHEQEHQLDDDSNDGSDYPTSGLMPASPTTSHVAPREVVSDTLDMLEGQLGQCCD